MLAISNYINYITFFLSLICLLIVLLRGDWKLPMIFLFASTSILFLQNIALIIYQTNYYLKFTYLIRVPGPFLYLGGPTIYLFVRTLFYNEHKLRRWDFLHFLPFIMNVVELMPFYLSSPEFKIKTLEVIVSGKLINYDLYREGLLGTIWHTILRVISWAIYAFFSCLIYVRFRRQIKSNLITDFESKFRFIRLFLTLRIVGFILAIIAVSFNTVANSIFFVMILNNLVNLLVVLLLFIKFPEFIYGNSVQKGSNIQREGLMNIALSQSIYLRLLESSKYDINILIDNNFKVQYYDKLAKKTLFNFFNKRIEFDVDLRDVMDLTLAPLFETNIRQALNGKEIDSEVVLTKYDTKVMSYFEINFRPFYNEIGKMVGVAIGANNIDEKRKMNLLQEQYVQSLDSLAWKSSHTLRAPVANMKGIVEVLQSNYIEKSPEESNQLLGYLSSELNRLDNVVIDMVDKAREELGS